MTSSGSRDSSLLLFNLNHLSLLYGRIRADQAVDFHPFDQRR